jgi:hypothetical protein
MTDLEDPGALMCHYTRAETAFARILPTRQLLMNPYSKMRDPFENKSPVFRWVSSRGEDERDAELRVLAAVLDGISRSRDAYCLLSLTEGDHRPGDSFERPFRCPWARARMWEQYAENHAGACLVSTERNS